MNGMTTQRGRREPLKVLLVEDNAADARLVTELLKDVAPAFVELTHAGRLRQALDYLSHEGFNAVLLDLSLPDSSGLATFLEAHARRPGTPIVVLTGLQDADIAERAVREGAQDYLVKGQVDGPLLLQSIRFAIERVRFEESLRASEARYRGLVDGSIQAIVIEVDGQIRLANPACAELFALPSPEACIGKDLWSHVIDEDRELVEGFVQSVRAGISVPARFECRVTGDDGIQRWLECSVANIPWDRARAIMATMVDISARKQAEAALRASEEQLRHAQKMQAVGRLAGGVAHDFNNVLTVITSYADLLLKDFGAGNDVLREDLMEIQHAATTAATLTRQLLAFTRQQVVQPRVVSLNDLVSGSVKMLQRLLEHDVALQLSLAADAPHIRADPGQMEQVLINLTVNARDAMPDGGVLHIVTAARVVDGDAVSRPGAPLPGHYAVLVVRDAGLGMSRETQARIFEPFFTTKEAGKGTGLGLATVYGIVKQCGGFIEVDSAEGRGTTFTIYLPHADAPAELEASEAPPLALRGRETLLLVEDTAAVRGVMRRVLERFGYVVIEAPDGRTALSLGARHQRDIDLLVTDHVLPGINGLALASQLRESMPGLRAVVISGYADDLALHPEALEPWAAFIQKPFSPETLAQRVRTLLDSPAAGSSRS